MRLFYLMILLSSVFLTLFNKPEDKYWKNAPMDGSVLYDIYFTEKAGYAVSNDDHCFISYDSGSTWKHKDQKDFLKISPQEFIWSARICCSSLKTTNGGKSWIPCSPNSQDKFCRVFLKDPNTGFQPAEEFLNMVSKKIFTGLLNEETDILKKPCQYTEYYSNKDEGWAPGWYLSDLITFDTLTKLK